MKVLMISLDKGLLGNGQLGDVVERHQKYGQYVDQLDIVVFSPTGFTNYKISDKVNSYPTNSLSKLKYYFDAIKIGKELFNKTKYDLIITQEPFVTGLVGVKLKKLFNTKLLVHFHGDFWDNPNWLKENKFNWLFLKMSKKVVPQADAIRVMSQGQKEKFSKLKNKLVKVISTPVDLEKYQNVSSKKNPNNKMVLHVGRYDKVKDFQTLLKAFEIVDSKLSNIDFRQIGADLHKIMDIPANLNFISQPNKSSKVLVEKWYPMSDVVVLSSTSESFGKVLVEANAAGKPVVSTATTGAKEIIQDGVNGYLAPIGDAQALADKILYLLNNPDKAKEMGENGRKLVKEKYGDNTNKIINFWQEIVNEK
ncbi:MAG: hypothetical protein CMI53_03440 [Parcubacteria group bacterium]|nr:hypothetical protein [Parcubacteria group bacterium]